MRLVADSGLWSTGATLAATPLVAVLEVSGAVLSWILDQPGAAAVEIAFTDPTRADWLWRVVGEAGHVALLSAVSSADATGSVDLTGVDIVPGSVEPLRKLAVGHWLRRWWPASRQDGIAGLDRALLDLEVALLTAGAQGYFADDTFDSDVSALLAPHGTALITHVRAGDPRVIDLVQAGAELADEAGVEGQAWSELSAALDGSRVTAEAPSGHRDDYALAAGAGGGRPGAPAIARGVASIDWSAVPPGIFDAGENTVAWSVEVADAAVVAVVRAAVIGPGEPTGVAVRLISGAITGAGALDAAGRAALPLIDTEQRPVTESAVWDHDWSRAAVIVGASIPRGSETPETRERVRRWARARLDRPADDAFLAEILAAESEY
ncbi:hypothetical protein MSAS_31390 [Mycobacterium saskatchewanense]|uniref:Uncharacterized protein n=1 Tax=Mycobacterium saskatchewanense TaxID=220927 RepID=A0AAJ3NLQ6_9MYCO|nr:hypothetical protein [Mycobacterium saskatchewanense]ORW64545.1 hypothetical protein AWC23_24810 [Mycobacterium saskatchewanense]BBX63965.1 hypothetical protein MSAS_31390 [Mycobacterium saskatchewanense]